MDSKAHVVTWIPGARRALYVFPKVTPFPRHGRAVSMGFVPWFAGRMPDQGATGAPPMQHAAPGPGPMAARTAPGPAHRPGRRGAPGPGRFPVAMAATPSSTRNTALATGFTSLTRSKTRRVQLCHSPGETQPARSAIGTQAWRKLQGEALPSSSMIETPFPSAERARSTRCAWCVKTRTWHFPANR